MGRLRRSRVHRNNRETHRACRTRARTRDLDQIHEDLQKTILAGGVIPTDFTQLNEELPGLGQFYCIECAKYFVSDEVLKVHKRGQPHKRRVKALKDDPYSQREAEMAAGLLPATRKESEPTETMAVEKDILIEA